MRIGNFEHKPSALIVFLYLLFLAALLALGTWQMKRAAQKIHIISTAQQALDTTAIAPRDLGDLHAAASAHTRVTISGNYDGSRQFLWDNRVHKSQAGYEVITPVKTTAGIVLVNRGWVAPGRTREDIPDISLSMAEQKAHVTGLFSRPSKGLVSGESLSRIVGSQSEPWPLLLQYFDYPAIEAALGEPVIAGVLQPQQVNAPSTQPEFYQANWEPAAAMGPSRHYGYAFQWYAMAAALTLLFIVYNTQRIEPGK